MKPYRVDFRGKAGYCVVLILLITFVTTALAQKKPGKKRAGFAPIVAKLGSDTATKKGFEHFYNMEYDKAIREFNVVVQAHPEDPFALNHLASAFLFKELYRIGALDSELYAKDDFLTSRQFPADAKARVEIRELMDYAQSLSEERLKINPDDVDALYARGITKGMRSTYMGLVDKSWFAALRNTIGARRDHERVLELSPGNTDAKFVVGVHNYIIGSVSWAVKVAASIIGLSGNREKGIKYLYEAANGGGETSVDAKIALSLFLRREQRYPEAISLVSSLMQMYPHNFLATLEHANLLNAAGRGPEAIAAYRKLLADAKAGAFPDARVEQAAYGLGESLRGQRDIKCAAEAYESVGSYKNIEPELQDRANLAAGEMYDLLEQREMAKSKYQEVIAADSTSRTAELARKRIKQPYRLPKV